MTDMDEMTQPTILLDSPAASVTRIESAARLGRANAQWASRPDDERYLSLQELHNAVTARREICKEKVRALEYLSVRADGGEVILFDKANPSGGAQLTNYSFSQLCARAKAPAGYLRSLPAELACIPLAWNLDHTERGDGKLLVAKSPDFPMPQMRAVTSSSYGRIWDSELTESLLRYCGPDSAWKVPAASYAAHNPKLASTLYASDRDVFVFLVDDAHPIEVPNEPGHFMFRGFFAWNSETGAGTYGMTTFLYDHVCDNRNVWGARDITELRIRHTAGAPERFLREATPALTAYLNAGTADTVQGIARAQEKIIGATAGDVKSWLRDRGFSAGVIAKSMEYADTVTGNPRSLWNVQQGLTATARDIGYTDERIALERKAGALMEAVF